MRILILHSTYESGPVSGENRVVQDEIGLLRSAGHDVESWTPTINEVAPNRVHAAARSVWSSQATRRVKDLIKGFKPDVVHVHNMYPALSPSVIRAASSRVPLILTLHNYRLMCLPGTFLRAGAVCELCLGRLPWRGVLLRCYRGSLPASVAIGSSLAGHRLSNTFESVTTFLAISEFVRSKHVEGGFPGTKIRVKPHFCWPGVRRTSAGSYFLYLGRLSPEKGPLFLAANWRTEWGRLVIAGDGPQREAIKERARPGVELIGSVPPDEAATLVSNARSLLMPSICYEGAGKVALEAYAAGVPVVASRMGGIPEVVKEGSTGFLVDPENHSQWSHAIGSLMDDDLTTSMGNQAYEYWQEAFTPEQGVRHLEAAYADVIEEAA